MRSRRGLGSKSSSSSMMTDLLSQYPFGPFCTQGHRHRWGQQPSSLAYNRSRIPPPLLLLQLRIRHRLDCSARSPRLRGSNRQPRRPLRPRESWTGRRQWPWQRASTSSSYSSYQGRDRKWCGSTVAAGCGRAAWQLTDSGAPGVWRGIRGLQPLGEVAEAQVVAQQQRQQWHQFLREARKIRGLVAAVGSPVMLRCWPIICDGAGVIDA